MSYLDAKNPNHIHFEQSDRAQKLERLIRHLRENDGLSYTQIADRLNTEHPEALPFAAVARNGQWRDDMVSSFMLRRGYRVKRFSYRHFNGRRPPAAVFNQKEEQQQQQQFPPAPLLPPPVASSQKRKNEESRHWRLYIARRVFDMEHIDDDRRDKIIATIYQGVETL